MKLLLAILSNFLFLYCSADDFLSGKMTVSPNETTTYTVNWPSWGTVYENNATVTWNVTFGTVVASDKHTITIQWDDIPTWINEIGIIEVSEDLGGQFSNSTVRIQNYEEGEIRSCSNFLGPASVFINFGSGSNPGSQLPASTTSYTYNSSCAISSGQYTIVNSTVGCRSAWLGIPEDHTPGDVNGYMLMIDGDNQRGEIYREVVSGLTKAFGYEFSAYGANLTTDAGNRYERPKVKFEIRDLSDILIAESGVFDIAYDPSDPWKKVSFMFEIPETLTSFYVVLVNQNSSQNGNDFVIDDISFAPCFPPIIASFSNTLIVERESICNNGTISLFSRWPPGSVTFPNPLYKWQRSINNGATWVDITSASLSMGHTVTESAAGVYKYRVYAYESTTPSNFVVSNILTYYVMQMSVSAKTHDVYNCNGGTFTLKPEFNLLYRDPGGNLPAYVFNWTPSTNLSANNIENPTMTLPIVSPPDPNLPIPAPTTYSYNLTVTLSGNPGCTASNTQTVKHYIPRKVVVMGNAFAPSDPNPLNRIFHAMNLEDYPGSTFTVRNRWGQVVFTSQGPTANDYKWNGTYLGVAQPADVYVWTIDQKGCPGNLINGDNNSNPYGEVTLVR